METNILFKNLSFAEIRDGLAIIRDGWRLNLLKNLSFSWNLWRMETNILFTNLSFFAEFRDGLAIIRDGLAIIRDGWKLNLLKNQSFPWNPWQQSCNPWWMETNILFKKPKFLLKSVTAGD